MASNSLVWKPTRILSHIEARPTGSSILRVETDQGDAFLKAMGATNGPNVLACELVGTLLAEWLGLRTLDFHVFDVPGDLDLHFADGLRVEAGPGFLSRAEPHQVWSGDPEELGFLENPEDLNLLIVLDTWTMNCDRYRPSNHDVIERNKKDNVFFSQESGERGKLVLKAMDHGCCFTCEGNVTTPALLKTMNNDRLYGRFPEFRDRTERDALLRAAGAVEAIDRVQVQGFIEQVPTQWQIAQSARQTWCEWICQRAKSVRRIIERAIPETNLFPPPRDQTS
jgi:hypothetical protein